MDNILELKDLTNFDYSQINLSNPTLSAGNNYYTKVSIGPYDKNLYIQLPKCKTKQGIVKNNTKCYTDLIYNASDTNVINWFENLEGYFQNQIFKKRELWFDTSIQLDDIQELMSPIMRSYKSGKNVLIRCYVKNNKCSIYDENEEVLDLESLKGESEIIPLMLINGIKFSSKSFFIDIFVSQIMLITSEEDLEKICLIKSVKMNKYSTKESKYVEEPLTKEPLTEESLTEEPLTEEPLTEEPLTEEPLTEEPLTEEPLTEEPLPENVNDSINYEKTTSEVNNNGFTEMNLDLFDNNNKNVQENLSYNSISLKKPNDIYYELYNTALTKAKNIRKNALEAFLYAKNIKLKYNLDDIDDIDDIDSDDEHTDNTNII